MFRFHTGSIKSPDANTGLSERFHCFDSILVRLKESVRNIDSSLIRFDSILVRLKDNSGLDPSYSFNRFDSILVRLKAQFMLITKV